MTHEALKALLDGMTLEEKAGQLTQCNAGQFIENSLQCGLQSVSLYLVKHLLHPVRLLTGLVDKIGLAKLHQHTFRAK